MQQFATPEGVVFPAHLQDMAYGDTITLTWNLGAAIGSNTISSISFLSCPNDFTFTAPSVSGGTVTTKISGGKCDRDYKITGTLITSDGQTRHPHCYVRCV
jgi:hypothetical protein